jgi:DNA-binding transcriptional LysR family regulator
MELWQLRTFSVVARNLHFTRAAEELNLSQPAVSHQIKLLETEIGEPLFLREKEGVSLTKAGQTMYEHAGKILDIADEMRLEISDNEKKLSGKLTLAVVSRGLGNPFPKFYKTFKKTYEDIEIVFQSEYKIENIVEKVRNGSIDIGVVTQDIDLTGLVVMPFGEFEILLVAGKTHPLANKHSVTIDDLQGQDWVTFESGNRIRLSSREYVAKLGIVPKSVYETNDGSLIRTMVAHDNKISLLPEWGVLEELQEGKMVPIKVKDFQFMVPVCLIWKASSRTKTMSTVLTYLLESRVDGFKFSWETNELM